MKEKSQFKLFLGSSMGRITITVVSMVVIYGLIILGAATGLFPIALVIFAICTYFGWQVLNKITPNIFLWMPIVGWIIYFLIKGVLSFFIGYIVAPFKIGKMIAGKVSSTYGEQ